MMHFTFSVPIPKYPNQVGKIVRDQKQRLWNLKHSGLQSKIPALSPTSYTYLCIHHPHEPAPFYFLSPNEGLRRHNYKSQYSPYWLRKPYQCWRCQCSFPRPQGDLRTKIASHVISQNFIHSQQELSPGHGVFCLKSLPRCSPLHSSLLCSFLKGVPGTPLGNALWNVYTRALVEEEFQFYLHM